MGIVSAERSYDSVFLVRHDLLFRNPDMSADPRGRTTEDLGEIATRQPAPARDRAVSWEAFDDMENKRGSVFYRGVP